jgi:rRNA maturation RNase YbeY
MLYVEVLDPKAARHKKTVVKTAQWLMKRFKKGGFYLEIALVGDATMKKNVYSYQAKKGFPYPGIKQKPLGEIYLNPSYIKREGEKVEFMVIHGFLHLLGYDHVRKSDTMKMERLEEKLLSELGLVR